jgi:predicted transcriptional regulator
VERGDWKTAANLPLVPARDAYPWQKYPQAEAINAYARGIGAATIQDPAAALAEVKRLQALRDALAAMKIGYWADQVDIQAEVVRGLATCAAGKHPEGIEILKAAAAREDATQKHAVTPGLLLPAREVLADVILTWGKPSDALREYETVLAKEPNRYRAFAGAAQAAAKAGDSKQAAYYSARMLELAGSADTARPEIAQARRTLGM